MYGLTALTPRFCCVVPATLPGSWSTCVSVEYIAPSNPGSWSFVVRPGSSVAIGTALLTISVALGLLAALLRPPELEEPELEELELEPHAASRSTTATAAIVAGAERIARAPELLVDFIVPPSVVRVIRPPSLVRFVGGARVTPGRSCRTYSTHCFVGNVRLTLRDDLEVCSRSFTQQRPSADPENLPRRRRCCDGPADRLAQRLRAHDELRVGLGVLAWGRVDDVLEARADVPAERERDGHHREVVAPAAGHHPRQAVGHERRKRGDRVDARRRAADHSEHHVHEAGRAARRPRKPRGGHGHAHVE